MTPSKLDARIAGWLYFLFAVAGPFSLLYVPGKIFVEGDVAATAANVLAREMLLRTSVVVWLLDMAVWIVLSVALYRLFIDVSKMLVLLLVIFVAISVGIGFLNELNSLAAILILRGNEFAGALTAPQRDSVAVLFLHLHGQGHAVNEMLWGLWLLPFGLLIARSHFMPRLLGIWLLIDGFAWMGLSMVALLFPSFNSLAFKVAKPAVFAELAVILWLIIFGVRVQTIERRVVLSALET